MKKTLSAVLCLVMLLGITPAVFAASPKFTDVSHKSWYYADVMNAVNLGLVNGKTETTYCPDNNLTYAEAMKLAACMHQLYTEGKVTLENGKVNWYDTYYNYCLEKKIVSGSYTFSEDATRSGYMEIFAHALPEEALGKLNNVPDGAIPDIDINAEYADEVYLLYRAGIVQGSDEMHNCKPDDNIKRSEVAAILSRMMDKEKRVEFSMADETVITRKESEGESKYITSTDGEFTFILSSDAKYNFGEKISHYIKVAGGSAPYSYQWEKRSGRNTTELEDKDGITGTKTDTVSYTYYPVSSINGSSIRLKVTDAQGKIGYSGYIECPKGLFVLSIEDSFDHKDGVIFSGRVLDGEVSIGQSVIIYMPEKNVLHKGTVSQISMFNKALDKAEKDDFCGIMISSDSYKTYGTEDDVFNALPGDVYMKKKIVDMADKGIMIPISLSSGSGFIEIDDIKAAIGQKASCTVDEIGGKAPYTYEWQEAKGTGEFKTITGLSGKEFSLVVKIEHYENRYRCKVTDADSKTVYSNEFKIVPTAMIQTVFPEDVYANYGNYVTLKAGAVGADGSKVTYKWRYKMATGREEDITSLDSAWAQGWDTPELEVFVEKDKFSHVLTFMCEMRDTAGNKIVTNAIGIKPEKPLVISQPSDTVKGSVGEWVKLNVIATGKYAPLKYTWKFTCDMYNGIFLPISKDHPWATGIDTNELSVYIDEEKYDPSLKFYCEITDSNGKTVKTREYTIATSASPNVSFQ